MNYIKIYNNIITKNKNLLVEGYSEIHHIIPRCLGGDDEPENLVTLTAREHFILHLLLVKIYPYNDKIIYAAHMMRTIKRYNSKHYTWLKLKHSKIVSEANKKRVIKDSTREKIIQNNKSRGKRSEETKQKIANSVKNNHQSKKDNYVAPMTGKKHSEETKQKMSSRHKNKVVSEETKQKISIAAKNRN